jgi:hypothetical protein
VTDESRQLSLVTDETSLVSSMTDESITAHTAPTSSVRRGGKCGLKM